MAAAGFLSHYLLLTQNVQSFIARVMKYAHNTLTLFSFEGITEDRFKNWLNDTKINFM